MAKKATPPTKVLSQDDFEAELKSTAPTFDAVAVSIIKYSNREYKVVSIPIDSKTLKTGELEVLHEVDNRPEAVELYKISIVRNHII